MTNPAAREGCSPDDPSGRIAGRASQTVRLPAKTDGQRQRRRIKNFCLYLLPVAKLQTTGKLAAHFQKGCGVTIEPIELVGRFAVNIS
jgi:hypothetical protein